MKLSNKEYQEWMRNNKDFLDDFKFHYLDSSYEWKNLLGFLLQMNSLEQRNYCNKTLIHNFQLSYERFLFSMETEYSRVLNKLENKIEEEN